MTLSIIIFRRENNIERLVSVTNSLILELSPILWRTSPIIFESKTHRKFREFDDKIRNDRYINPHANVK